MIARIIAAACAAFALAVSAAHASPETNKHKDVETLQAELAEKADIYRKLKAPMRDGVGLSTDVYVPKNRKGGAPAIFWRTPYDYDPVRKIHLLQIHEAIDRGYAFVMQNERGRFFSEGDWVLLGDPQKDGVDALDWIAEQDWSNGKVGLLGCSSPAEWQLALAAQDHPALAAMVPAAPGAGIGKAGPYVEHGNWYRGGAEQMFYAPWLYNSVQPDIRPLFSEDLTPEQRALAAKLYDLSPEMPEADWSEIIRTLPIRDHLKVAGVERETYSEFIARTPASKDWREGGLFYDDTMQIEAPALWLFSWYDVSIAPNLALYQHARSNEDKATADAQYAVVGPNLHCAFWSDRVTQSGDRTFKDADFGAYETVFSFFDRYLMGKRNGFERSQPAVKYYDMGSDGWRTTKAWPPEGAETVEFYLSSEDGANSLSGDGALVRSAPEEGGADSFAYDPMNPVPSLGGGICCIGDAVEGGAFDQRSVEARSDVLVYTSEPLEDDLVVAGPVGVTLYVSSDAPDTDFTVKLVDVFPDGTAYNLDETIQRVRWREGYEKRAAPMEDGETYEIEFQPMTTANTFKAGHRVRLEVSSSNFPRFSRNLNTGGANYDESEGVVANNTVRHSKAHPSKLTLTVTSD